LFQKTEVILKAEIMSESHDVDHVHDLFSINVSEVVFKDRQC